MAETQREPLSGYSSDDEEETGIANTNRYTTAETPLLGRDAPSEPRHLYRQNVVILIMVSIFFLELFAGMTMAPMSAVMENIVCRKRYDEVSDNIFANDPRCKNPDVQGELAMLRGWGYTFDCIPGMIGALPYGILSDKWGRKPVFMLSILGTAMATVWIYVVMYFSNTFPLWMFWFGSAFQLIGGSSMVSVAMIYTMAADVVPVNERATVFFQVQSIFLVAEMISGPLAGILMHRSPWLALLVALGFILLANCITLIFPETLDVHKLKDRQQAAALANGSHSAQEDAGSETQPSKLTTRQQAWRLIRSEVVAVWDFVIKNQRVAYLLLSLVFVVLGRFVSEMLLQYATKRYGWTWDRAALLITIRSASMLLLLAVVLPAASWLCLNTLRMPVVAKDLWLARVSGIVQTAGALLVAFSVNGAMLMGSLVVFAAGGGMTALIRSLTNALVEEHHIGVLNSLIGFMEMAGLMVAGPILAKTLGLGFEWGGLWEGLPFMFSALLFTVSTAIVFTFRIPKLGRAAEYP